MNDSSSKQSCTTCSDNADLATIVELRNDLTAIAKSGESLLTIDISTVGYCSPGDRVLVHGGAAIALMDKHSNGGSAEESNE